MISNYVFGLKPPVENAQLVDTQMSLGHRYRNKLVEIAQRYPGPTKGQTETEAAKATRVAAMKKEIKEARAGLNWGTYLICDQAAATAKSFRRWDGSGVLGMQLQHGLAVTGTAIPDDTRVQIIPLPWAYVQPRTNRVGAKGLTSSKWMLLRVRIGSDEKKKPVWGSFPIKMHRPFPPGTRIKWIQVRRDARGDHRHWTAMFTIEIPDFVRTDLQGAVGVDIGWRRMPDGHIRAGYWYGSDGAEGEIAVPQRIEDLYEMIDRFKTGRANNLNSNKSTVAAELAQLGFPQAKLWRNAERFAGAVRRLHAQATMISQQTWAWFLQDRHLANAIAGMHRQLVNQRNDIFKNIAATLTKKYGVCGVESFSLKKLRTRNENKGEVKDKTKAKPRTDGDSVKETAARRLALLAAPGHLRSTMENAARAHGGVSVRVPAATTTSCCADCKHVNKWTDASPLVLTCTGCGRSWDQDRNAARNLCFAAGSPVSGWGKKTKAATSERQSRFRKAKQKQVDATAS